MSLLENGDEPQTKKAKTECEQEENHEEEVDRFSDLPNCILINILTLMSTKDAVKTCILSKTWNNLWKSLPILVLHSSDFKTIKSFTRFVRRVLSLRHASLPLHTLDFKRAGLIEPSFLKRVLCYAYSHGVKDLRLSICCDCEFNQIPQYFFNCKALTSLQLLNYRKGQRVLPCLPKPSNWTLLTRLDLWNFAFAANGDGSDSVEPFSSCVNLKSLRLVFCAVRGATTLCISNATLSTLIIRASPVVQKEAYNIKLSTPSLSSFAFYGVPTDHKLSAGNVPLLREVNIEADLKRCSLESAWMIIKWLKELDSVRSLTISSSTLQVLSLIPRMSKTEYPVLGNMKSLVVETKDPKPKYPIKSSSILDRVVDYLVQNSPIAEDITCEYRGEDLHFSSRKHK